MLEITIWPCEQVYMHNPESILKNKMQKITYDFAMQRYILISTKQPDLMIVNK